MTLRASPYTFSRPSGSGAGVYKSALSRWLEQQKQSQGQFATAEQPLQQAVQMFQKGGGYGEGQRMLLRDEAKKALAETTASQVASGMSSGSLASSTALRTKSDLAKNLAGVEDVRTQFLTQALQALSGLRGTQAQTTATVSDPTYAPYMSYVSGKETTAAQQAAATLQAQTSRHQTYMQTEAQKYIADLEAELEKNRMSKTQPSSGVYSTLKF